MAIVYRHRRLDTFEVFYVGIGTKEGRAYNSINRNNYWKNVVNKHGYSVEILASGLSWKDACELETLLISEYGRKDLGTGFLVNLTNGGEGTVGAIHTKEAILKFSKSINQYTLEGLFIKEWQSAAQAGKELAIHSPNITACCKGKNRYAGNYIWTYKGCKPTIIILGGYRAVVQHTKEGQVLKEWGGALIAGKELGISKSNITNCCKGVLKSAGGFVWKYKQ